MLVSLSKLRSMTVKPISMVKYKTLIKLSFLCSYGGSLSVFVVSQTSVALPALFKTLTITLPGLFFAKKTISYIFQELNISRNITFCHTFLYQTKNKCL